MDVLLIKDYAVIYGSNGRIVIDHITNFSKIIIFNSNDEYNEINRENQITGFEYQVIECIHSISNKQLETKSMPHKNSLDIITLCDNIRSENKIK